MVAQPLPTHSLHNGTLQVQQYRQMPVLSSVVDTPKKSTYETPNGIYTFVWGFAPLVFV